MKIASIVSENGGNETSAEVCAEFTSLPITYVFQNPVITALEHGVALFEKVRHLPHQYVAGNDPSHALECGATSTQIRSFNLPAGLH